MLSAYSSGGGVVDALMDAAAQMEMVDVLVRGEWHRRMRAHSARPQLIARNVPEPIEALQ